MGTVIANVADAVDGRDIKPNKKISNGYVKKAWLIESEAKMLVFQGSTLVRELAFAGADLKEELAAGEYSCMTIYQRFYANYVRDCIVLPTPQKTFLGQISLSPWLNPGNTRIVLNWGAKPKDLDSYLNVPSADPAQKDCILNYQNKECNQGKLSEVKLDLDATGFTPPILSSLHHFTVTYR
jgi:hypothetical protein